MPREFQVRAPSVRQSLPVESEVEAALAAADPTRCVAESAAARAMSILLARAHRLRFHAPVLALAFVALSAASARAAEPDLAIRVEGYVGYSQLDFIREIDAFQGGGSGSLSLVYGPFYVQGDVFGDVMDFEGDAEFETVGPGLHLGWRDAQRGSAGVVGSYDHFDGGSGSLDVYRTGIEGEVYLDRVTLGLNGGYLDFAGSGSIYVDGLVTFYPIERARLSLRAGAFDIEDGSPLVDFGVGGEYLATSALSPFLRWEASVPDAFDDVFQQSIVAGLNVYWGGGSPSLATYDRAHFKPSCGGVLLFGRLC